MSSTANIRHIGEPVQLWWTFAAGLVLWALILFIFGHLVSSKDLDVATPPPIDAQLIELPEAKALAAPARQQTPVIKPRNTVSDAPTVSRTVDKTVEQPVVKENPAPEQASVSKPVPVSNASSGNEKMGARAIYQPLPKIPDDLRDEAIRVMVMARFHINPDGTATVELLKASSNPRINQIIMNTLKTWKFFPALQDGKPISSTQDIKVDFNVQ